MHCLCPVPFVSETVVNAWGRGTVLGLTTAPSCEPPTSAFAPSSLTCPAPTSAAEVSKPNKPSKRTDLLLLMVIILNRKISAQIR